MAAADEGKVARKYGRALFDAYQPAELENVRATLAQFLEAWRESGELRGAMKNPAVPLSARSAVLAEVARRIAPNDARFENFLKIVLENGRIEAIAAIAATFNALVDDLRSLLALEVQSAFELPQDERRSAEERMRAEFGGLASVKWTTDPELIGGLVLRSGDRQIDQSLRGALKQLRGALLH